MDKYAKSMTQTTYPALTSNKTDAHTNPSGVIGKIEDSGINGHALFHVKSHTKIQTFVALILSHLTSDFLNTTATRDTTDVNFMVDTVATDMGTDTSRNGVSGWDAVVEVYAEGKAITKAISVVEIVKRKFGSSGHTLTSTASASVSASGSKQILSKLGVVKQETQVGTRVEKEEWVPNEQDMDKIVATRHIPYIRILLRVE